MPSWTSCPPRCAASCSARSGWRRRQSRRRRACPRWRRAPAIRRWAARSRSCAARAARTSCASASRRAGRALFGDAAVAARQRRRMGRRVLRRGPRRRRARSRAAPATRAAPLRFRRAGTVTVAASASPSRWYLWTALAVVAAGAAATGVYFVTRSERRVGEAGAAVKRRRRSPCCSRSRAGCKQPEAQLRLQFPVDVDAGADAGTCHQQTSLKCVNYLQFTAGDGAGSAATARASRSRWTTCAISAKVAEGQEVFKLSPDTPLPITTRGTARLSRRPAATRRASARRAEIFAGTTVMEGRSATTRTG